MDFLDLDGHLIGLTGQAAPLHACIFQSAECVRKPFRPAVRRMVVGEIHHGDTGFAQQLRSCRARAESKLLTGDKWPVRKCTFQIANDDVGAPESRRDTLERILLTVRGNLSPDAARQQDVAHRIQCDRGTVLLRIRREYEKAQCRQRKEHNFRMAAPISGT